MDISIIIPNYNSEQYLPSCLKSLQAHLFTDSYEIIIVNNDNAPITSVVSNKNLQLLHTGLNEGFARACNRAAHIAKGDILFFLNPDTEIVAGNISTLLATLRDSAVGIASPQLVLPSGEIQPWSAGYEITLLEVLRNNCGLIRSQDLWKKSSPNQPDWTSGAALAIKQSLFRELTGFDSNFFMYFEDVDLCRRVKEKGLAIVILPAIQVLHLGGQSFSGAGQQKKYYYDSQDYYFKKHFGILFLFFLKLLRSFALLFRNN